MVEHRVPMRSGALQRAVDPAHSPDPAVRTLVTALAGLPVSPPPREHFRAELRAQLVAVTPRLVSEGMEGLVKHTPESFATAHVRPSPLHLLSLRLPHLNLSRSVRLATAALAAVVVLASGAVWLARSALPGDPLYNVKRASENAQLSLESGTGKATSLLALAKTRVSEVADLLSIPSAAGTGPQADGSISDRTAALISSTLDSADDDLRQASTLLTTQAVRSHSAAPLQTMISWAPQQQSRLGQIVDHLPDGSSLQDRANSSWQLVQSAYARAQALRTDLGCDCLRSSGSDALGPLPCASCDVGSPQLPVPGANTASGSQGQTPPRGGSSDGGSSTSTTGTGGGSGSKAPSGGGGPLTGLPVPGLPGGSSSSGAPLPLPTLPHLPLPSLPALPGAPTSTAPLIGLNSCGATVNLGPIGIGVGRCGIHLNIAQ